MKLEQKKVHSVSVVISTLNRAKLLRNCLHSLRYQNHDDFEVVVVNGPSTDATEELLAEYADDIIVGRIAEANLSKSRNAGIALASGSLILFLDDDAYPEPEWINTVVSGFDSPAVGGVGTRVYDHSGFAWQSNPFTIDQFYKANFERRPPVWAFEFSDSRTIPHILGASSSFRRDLLEEIGGFDEEIEYFLDESEMCRRVAESGHKIRFLDHGACVHHKFAAGVTRDERRILTYPYPVVKNKYYVALSDCLRHGRNVSEYLDHCDAFVQELMDGALWQLNHQGISQAEFDRFVTDVKRGQKDGLARAGVGVRKCVALPLPAVDAGAARKRFKTLRPAGGRRSFCFISRYMPKQSPGGVARFMFDLASGFAERGHDVHLITMRSGPSEIEYDNGLWIHHLGAEEVIEGPRGQTAAAGVLDMRSGPGKMNCAWAKAAHAEVLRLRQDRFIDLVVAPAWDQEGLYCALDRRLTTVISMNTTFKTFAEIERKGLDGDTLREVTALEATYLRLASAIHANSNATAQHVEVAFGLPRPPPGMIVGHGCRDAADTSLSRAAEHRRQPGGTVTVLYVSRLERRKGTDIFMAALSPLLKACPTVKVRVVGRDSYAGDASRSYLSNFAADHPDLSDKVSFLGQVSDAELAREYEQADIFCVPSRYESFGIIYVEAMRYSLPVVAAGVGGIPDIVVDGETGLLTPPENSRALADALARLAGDRVLRQRLGANGRARFKALFDHDVIIDRTLDAFLRLLKSRQAPVTLEAAAHAAD